MLPSLHQNSNTMLRNQDASRLGLISIRLMITCEYLIYILFTNLITKMYKKMKITKRQRTQKIRLQAKAKPYEGENTTNFSSYRIRSKWKIQNRKTNTKTSTQNQVNPLSILLHQVKVNKVNAGQTFEIWSFLEIFGSYIFSPWNIDPWNFEPTIP